MDIFYASLRIYFIQNTTQTSTMKTSDSNPNPGSITHGIKQRLSKNTLETSLLQPWKWMILILTKDPSQGKDSHTIKQVYELTADSCYLSKMYETICYQVLTTFFGPIAFYISDFSDLQNILLNWGISLFSTLTTLFKCVGMHVDNLFLCLFALTSFTYRTLI